MSSFWKNASIMAISELFLKLKALVMMPFITRYLGTVNYGIWSQVMVIVSVMSPLVFCGMDSSLARFLPGQTLEKQRQEFTGWFIFGIVTSTFLLILICSFRYPFSELFFGNEKDYPTFVILAGFNIVVTSLITGVRNWFRVQNNAWPLVTITVAQNILQMLVLIWVLLSQQGIYELVLWSLIVDGILLFSYLIYLFKNQVFTRPSINWIKSYFRFGIVLLPSGYAIWILNSLDRVFLAQYHSLSDIGIYSICFTIGYTLIQMIVNPTWSLFPTKAAELYNAYKIEELNQLFNQSIKFICWIILPSVFGLMVVGEPLLKVLTTDEFASGYLVISIILLGYFFLMISAYFETILILKNKPYLSTLFTIVACLINILLNFALIPSFSYVGAAIATTISFAMQLSLSIFYAANEKVVSLDYKPIVKILIAGFIMFISTLFIKYKIYYLDNKEVLLIIISIGVFIYSLFTHFYKIYNFKDLAMLIRRKGVHV